MNKKEGEEGGSGPGGLAELLIDRSGYRLEIPDDEPIDDLVVATASGQIDFDELVGWFAARIARERQSGLRATPA